MGKTRRYKKKLARAVAAGADDGCGTDERQPRQTNYMELADELLSLKGDDGTTSVRSVMKSVKSGGGGESIRLKKEAKLFLKHALLLKSQSVLLLLLLSVYSMMNKGSFVGDYVC